MIRLLNFIEENGGMLLLGVSAILCLGALLCFLHSSPAKRQRICEFSLLFTLLWLALACIPINRLHLHLPSLKTAPIAPANPLSIGTGVPAGLPLSAANAPIGRSPDPANNPIIETTASFEPLPIALDAPVDRSPTPAITPSIETTPPADEITLPAAPIANKPSTPSSTPSHIIPIALLIGSCLMTLRILLGQFVLFRIFSHSKPDRHLATLAANEGAPRVDVRVSHRLSRPISFGLLRAKIILPHAHTADPNRVRQVLLHEIAHIQRKDAWGNLLMNLAGILLWFHPAYWILNSQARLARELLADDWAANKGDKQTYAMELIAIARMRVGSGSAGGVALGIMGSRSEFFRRMHMLISRKHNLEMNCSKLWRAGMFTVGLGLAAGLTASLGVKPVAAAEPPATPPIVNIVPGEGIVPSVPTSSNPNDVVITAATDEGAAAKVIVKSGNKTVKAGTLTLKNGQKTYTVKPGDTMTSISKAIFGKEGFQANILKANPNINPDQLKPGQVLIIPEMISFTDSSFVPGEKIRTVEILPGDTLKSIAQKIFKDEKASNEFLEANKSVTPEMLKPGVILVISLENKAIISLTTPSPATEMDKLVESYVKLGMDFLDQELKLMAEKHVAMQQNLAEAQLNLERTLKRLYAGQEDSNIADRVDNNVDIRKLRDQIASARQEFETVANRQGEDSPQFKAALDRLQRSEDELNNERRKIEGRIRVQMENSLKEQAEAANQNLQAMEQRIQAMQKAMTELKRLKNVPPRNVLVTPNPFQTDPKTLLRGVTLTGTILGTGDDQGKATAVLQIDGVGIRECHVGDTFFTPMGSLFTVVQIQSNQATLKYNDTLYDLTMGSIVAKGATPANVAPPNVEKPVEITRKIPDISNSSLPIDLINLANTAMEARGEVKMAKLKRVFASNPNDTALAQASLENTQQKADLLKEMVRSASASAESNLKMLEAKRNAGLINEEQFSEQALRAQMLKTILQSLE